MIRQTFLVSFIQQQTGFNRETVASILLCLSCILGYFATKRIIPVAKQKLFERGIYGVDINKTTKEERDEFKAAKQAAAGGKCGQQGFPEHLKKYVVPESAGIAVGTMYLACVVIYAVLAGFDLAKINAAYSSIAFMLLLGFADDVLDVRWKHKIVLSLLASLPLLASYDGPTSIKVPLPFRPAVTSLVFEVDAIAPAFNLSHIVGFNADRTSVVIIPLGMLYLAYMSLICVFCTNSINILAGVNGVEVGQSIVIAVAQAAFCIVQLVRGVSDVQQDPNAPATGVEGYWISLSVLVPFIGCSLALYQFNKYPSQVFVGDSYTYLSGMVLAVAGISGSYSKTLLLFFLPQLFNFVISLPQLFGIFGFSCPPHRVPTWNKKTNLLENSRNLTILNAVLAVTGPLHERTLTNVILCIQAACCIVGFWVRFTMAGYVYEQVH